MVNWKQTSKAQSMASFFFEEIRGGGRIFFLPSTEIEVTPMQSSGFEPWWGDL
jgi:hypothetical protein